MERNTEGIVFVDIRFESFYLFLPELLYFYLFLFIREMIMFSNRSECFQISICIAEIFKP